MWTRSKKILKDQSGVALVIALLMMIVLTLIGLGSVFTSSFETRLSGNKRGATDAFFAADGGIEATKADKANFYNPAYNAYSSNPPGTYALIPNTGGLPPDLKNEKHINSKWTPALNYPPAASITDPPTVIVYYVGRAGGWGVTNSQAKPGCYIIDSTGRDQRAGLTLVRSQSEIREKLVVATASGEMDN